MAKKCDEVYAKTMFLGERHETLTIETKSGKIKLHSIFLHTNKQMKINYGTTIKDLKAKFPYSKDVLKSNGNNKILSLNLAGSSNK